MKEQKNTKKMRKHNVKSIKGITLIALVVTIVVLLILASVSITVIFGDNGLIEMAREAADKTNEAVEKDLGDIQNLTNELNDFMNPPTPTPEPPTEVTSGNTQEKYIDIGETFTIKVQDSTEAVTVSIQNEGDNVVTVDENTVTGAKVGNTTLTVTWNGSNSATINVHVYDPTTIGAPKRIEDYGKIVVDYKDTENTRKYRLFYQDKNYTYIISDNLITQTLSLEELYKAGEYENKTGADVSEIGKRLNPMLKDAEVNNEGYTFFSNGEKKNEYDNIKAVGWLTDPEKWTEYANGEEDVFAIGSPTLELFAASYNTMDTGDNGKKDNIIPEVKQYGYSENTSDNWLTNGQREGIYNTGSGSYWWLASPSYILSNGVFFVRENGGYLHRYNVHSTYAVRPLVCIPTSKFDTKYGDNLKWKNELGD